MNMGELITRDVMTVREVADVLGVSYSAVDRAIGKLFPDMKQNGIATHLSEVHVTAIKMEIGKHHNLFSTEKVQSATTDLEMELLANKVMMWQAEKISRLRAENKQLSTTVNMLTHSNKTYTTTEIGKELNFKSPQEFNTALSGMKVIFKVNGTWVLTSQYAGQGYTETKQQEVNGIVIYNTQWTDKGRVFLLNLFPDRINKKEELI